MEPHKTKKDYLTLLKRYDSERDAPPKEGDDVEDGQSSVLKFLMSKITGETF